MKTLYRFCRALAVAYNMFRYMMTDPEEWEEPAETSSCPLDRMEADLWQE